MYKKMVVGVAILSSPRETYITYLAVKAGWEKAQIGKLVAITLGFSSATNLNTIFSRTMLYHLICLNPHKDITLHVSVNSPAMVRRYFSQIIDVIKLFTCSSFIINLDSRPKSLLQDSIHHTSILSPVHLKMRFCFVFAINDPGSSFLP